MLWLQNIFIMEFQKETRNVSQCDKCPQRQKYSRTEARCQGLSDTKPVYDTLQPQDVIHTKFGIPTSNNIRDMVCTRFF